MSTFYFRVNIEKGSSKLARLRLAPDWVEHCGVYQTGPNARPTRTGRLIRELRNVFHMIVLVYENSEVTHGLP